MTAAHVWTRIVVGGLLACSPAAASAQGTIQGSVTTHARTPPPIRVSFDQRVCGAELPDQSILVGAGGGVANAIITLVGVKDPSPNRQPVVMNEKCAFVPRVQAVAPGATVKTSSTDPVLHTTVVQQQDGRQLFNVALPAPGIEIAKTLNGPGVLRVGCSTHQWMRGWIMVTDDRAVVTDANGRFTMTDVPPGTYEVSVWHEALKAPSQKVTVTAGKPVNLQIELK